MCKRSFAKACLLLRIASQVSVEAYFPLVCVELFNNEFHTALFNKLHPLVRYLQPLTWEGSLSYRAYRDAGSWFLLSNPNEPLMSSSISRLVRREAGTEDLFLPGSSSLKKNEYIWLIKQIIPWQWDILFMNKCCYEQNKKKEKLLLITYNTIQKDGLLDMLIRDVRSY